MVVDAYGPDEQAMGWYAYLENTLEFPFRVRCSVERAISPLRVDDEVEVVDMGPESECAREMFVLTPWQPRLLAVPLMQLDVSRLRTPRARRWRTGSARAGALAIGGAR